MKSRLKQQAGELSGSFESIPLLEVFFLNSVLQLIAYLFQRTDKIVAPTGHPSHRPNRLPLREILRDHQHLSIGAQSMSGTFDDLISRLASLGVQNFHLPGRLLDGGAHRRSVPIEHHSDWGSRSIVVPREFSHQFIAGGRTMPSLTRSEILPMMDEAVAVDQNANKAHEENMPTIPHQHHPHFEF